MEIYLSISIFIIFLYKRLVVVVIHLYACHSFFELIPLDETISVGIKNLENFFYLLVMQEPLPAGSRYYEVSEPDLPLLVDVHFAKKVLDNPFNFFFGGMRVNLLVPGI